MQHENLQRLGEVLRSQGVAGALLSNPSTLTWLTGYAPPIQFGPSPFEAGPALAWWTPEGVTLVVSNLESAAAKVSGAQVLEYVGYTIEEPLAPLEKQRAVLIELLKHAGRLKGIGVEADTLGAALLEALRSTCSKAELKPVDRDLEALRVVKTQEEIAKLRAVVRLCDQAQALTRDVLRGGLTELEMWGAMKARLEAAAGVRLPILADFVGGVRTAEVGGPPGAYRLQPGDPLMADIVARFGGYWGDNTDVHFVGEPKPELARAYRAVLTTLRAGIAAVRPGVKAKDLDTQMRAVIRENGFEPYPHHSGHGVGTAYHEEPRIVPYNDRALEPGMVLALEPGVYLPGLGGIRLEDVVLVNQDGCEVLTTHLSGK